MTAMVDKQPHWSYFKFLIDDASDAATIIHEDVHVVHVAVNKKAAKKSKVLLGESMLGSMLASD
jgi:hypothetical protein